MSINPDTELPQRRRGKFAAATLLIAAGAAVAGALGTAVPANAAGLHVAIAYSPEGGYVGYGNFASSIQAANTAAMNMCESRGGADSNCQPMGWAYDGCVALAVNGTGYAPSSATTPALAEQGALYLTHGGQIIDVACSTNAG
jgi:hypothetical protein